MQYPGTEQDWHSYHSNLVAFAQHLVHDHDFDAKQLLYYMEKPWKWTKQFIDWRQAGGLEATECFCEEEQADASRMNRERAP